MSPYYIPYDPSQDIKPVPVRGVTMPDQFPTVSAGGQQQQSDSGSDSDSKPDVDYTKAIAGGVGLLANAYNMSRQGLNIPATAPGIEYSATGQPSYNGDRYNTVSGMRVQKTGFGEVATAAGSGAAAGATLSPIGAAVGAVVGAGAALIGGAARRRRQQRQKDLATSQAIANQKTYNTALKDFTVNDNARQDYDRRRNNYAGMNNLYSTQLQSY